MIFVCGMIGSGKTEFCKQFKAIVSDRDEFESKEKQIEFTIKNLSKTNEIYHISCYPTIDEMDKLFKYTSKFIWINTSFEQCRKNILRRSRGRDIQNFSLTLEKNREILNKYLNSKIEFDVIDIFETDERW